MPHRAFHSLAGLLVLAGCHDEVTRLRSPSGALEAVVIEGETSVLNPFTYDVYVTPAGRGVRAGEQVAWLSSASRSKQSLGVNVRWTAPDTLAISYLSASWEEPVRDSVRVASQRVMVTVQAHVDDPTAAPGCMACGRR